MKRKTFNTNKQNLKLVKSYGRVLRTSVKNECYEQLQHEQSHDKLRTHHRWFIMRSLHNQRRVQNEVSRKVYLRETCRFNESQTNTACNVSFHCLAVVILG